VRYETNVELHAHFRCHLCARFFDLVGGQQDPGDTTDPGFVVERVETRAEGICDECTSYETGLTAGACSIRQSGPAIDTLSVTGAAASEIASPLGPLLLAATPLGLTRLAFEDHGDADALRVHASTGGAATLPASTWPQRRRAWKATSLGASPAPSAPSTGNSFKRLQPR
jgi:hypothetical protein